jgi:hypothetical protein
MNPAVSMGVHGIHGSARLTPATVEIADLLADRWGASPGTSAIT